jgi:succinate--hydroxymethylglutarate CoA-transferase
LKKPAGVDLIHRLVKQCDVVVENFKPGWTKKLNIDFETLRELKPDLIYASITGFGVDGPDRDRLSYDVFVSAATGLMSITGDAEPAKVGVAMTDLHTGALMSQAIVAALFHRSQTGEGQRIDTSLFETQLAALANVGSAHLVAGVEARRWGTAHASIVPYQAFRAKHDARFTAGALNDAQWQRLVGALTDVVARQQRDAAALAPPLAAAWHWLQSSALDTNARRVALREPLIDALQQLFQLQTVAEWQRTLDAAGVPCAPINSVAQAFALGQTRARRMIETIEHPTIGALPMAGFAVKFGSTPCAMRLPPPLLSQHTRSLLAELLDIDAPRFDALRRDGIV